MFKDRESTLKRVEESEATKTTILREGDTPVTAADARKINKDLN